jgi:hypothetical protein
MAAAAAEPAASSVVGDAGTAASGSAGRVLVWRRDAAATRAVREARRALSCIGGSVGASAARRLRRRHAAWPVGGRGRAGGRGLCEAGGCGVLASAGRAGVVDPGTDASDAVGTSVTPGATSTRCADAASCSSSPFLASPLCSRPSTSPSSSAAACLAKRVSERSRGTTAAVAEANASACGSGGSATASGGASLEETAGEGVAVVGGCGEAEGDGLPSTLVVFVAAAAPSPEALGCVIAAAPDDELAASAGDASGSPGRRGRDSPPLWVSSARFL